MLVLVLVVLVDVEVGTTALTGWESLVGVGVSVDVGAGACVVVVAGACVDVSFTDELGGGDDELGGGVLVGLDDVVFLVLVSETSASPGVVEFPSSALIVNTLLCLVSVVESVKMR